ncbi:MAG: TolC family protein [Bacteroidales bacterium]|nr:TolC family protein [Bacteroidales bacterium]
MRNIRLIITACIFLAAPHILRAQPADDQVQVPLSLNDFLSGVTRGNLGFIANSLNVSIAEAELRAAKVFADPEVAVEYSNSEDWSLQMGQSLSAAVSYPVSLGNKRGASIGVARTRMELEQYLLESWLQDLKAEASLAYYACLRDLQTYRLEEDTYLRMQELARADSLRFITGEIPEIDAVRTRLEAHARLYELKRLRSDLDNSLLNLSRLQGRLPGDTLFVPSGDFPVLDEQLILGELTQRALEHRADLSAAIKSGELSAKELRLLRAERAPEFSLEASYSHNSVVMNEIAPAPEHRSYAAGLVIPLKFSSLNRGAVMAASLAAEQSELTRKDVENLIITEVTQAYNVYVVIDRQIENYSRDLIESAERILDGRMFLYRRGETGLIDVLEAQRTYNEMKMQYYQIMYDYAAAITELRRAQAIE